MRIEHKCSCGATIVFADERGTFINPYGEKDAKGRIFQVEVKSDEWLELHQRCRTGMEVQRKQQGKGAN